MWLTIATAMAGHPGPLAGVWTYAGGETGRASIAAAVEDGSMRFNFAIRPIVRSKLGKVARLDTRIAIEGDASTVKIVFDGENPRTSGGPSDGTKVHLHGNDVSYVVSEGRMVVRGTGDDGGKETVYVVSGSTMTVTHTVWSPQLGDPPLVWTLTYARQP